MPQLGDRGELDSPASDRDPLKPGVDSQTATHQGALLVVTTLLLAGVLAFFTLPGQVGDGAPECSAALLRGLMANDTVSWGTPPPPPRTGWRRRLQRSSAPQLPQLQLQRCVLRQFTPPEAKECLSRRPLVMIGDSVTRYQFLSLIYWLDSGEWPPPMHGTPDHPSPMIESEWQHGWADFFRGTTDPFNGRQQCHCFRDGWDIREDRFYALTSTASASFYMWFGYPLKPLIGRWGFPPFGNATRCAPGDCGGDPDWSLPLDEGLRQVVARLHPATIVFNSGLWRSPGGENWPAEVYEAIMGAAVDAVRPQGGTCIWKTTTFALDGRIPRTWDDPALQHAAAHGLGVMDAWALTRAAAALDPPPWVDDLHFLGYVYQELNRFLLNMIC